MPADNSRESVYQTVSRLRDLIDEESGIKKEEPELIGGARRRIGRGGRLVSYPTPLGYGAGCMYGSGPMVGGANETTDYRACISRSSPWSEFLRMKAALYPGYSGKELAQAFGIHGERWDEYQNFKAAYNKTNAYGLCDFNTPRPVKPPRRYIRKAEREAMVPLNQYLEALGRGGRRIRRR